MSKLCHLDCLAGEWKMSDAKDNKLKNKKIKNKAAAQPAQERATLSQ